MLSGEYIDGDIIYSSNSQVGLIWANFTSLYKLEDRIFLLDVLIIEEPYSSSSLTPET